MTNPAAPVAPADYSEENKKLKGQLDGHYASFPLPVLPPFNASNIPTPPVGGTVNAEDLTAALAFEVALGALDTPAILSRYGISAESWQQLRTMPVFQHMVQDMHHVIVHNWSNNDRIKARAAIALEDSIRHLTDIVQSTGESAASVIAATRTLMELAGMDSKKQVAAQSGPITAGFQLNIHLGPREDQVTTISLNTEKAA